jgi:valyl-tRNA synthetase
MGHMLNNTIQDVLIRRARLKGKNACWVPGTDHASIATEAKVVSKLKEKGIDKNDLSREDFFGACLGMDSRIWRCYFKSAQKAGLFL